MARKTPDPRHKGAPVRDLGLWRAVGRTVSPLPRRKSTDPKAVLEALEKSLNAPGQEPEPKAPRAKSDKKSAPAFPPVRNVVPVPPRSPTREKPIEPGLKKRLERGRLPIDGILDLHGMTQTQAQSALERFIKARAARGDRTILVITGKGLKKTGYLQIEQKGILRAMVPAWLNAPELAPLIAGIDAAHQSHGGEGALYIRLKRKRERR